MTHVPYRGMPQAVNDVVGNHVQMVFADPAGAPPLIKDGKLRPLAVSSLVRIGSLPDVPTIEEAGFTGFEAVSWHMIVGAGRHAEADRRPAARRVQAHRDVAGLQGAGRQHGPARHRLAPPDELKRYLDKEIARWGKLVKDVGIAGTE